MQFEYNNITYDFRDQIDAYIFASFLKEMPLILSHQGIINRLKVELKNIASANLNADDREFNRAIVKTIRFFHADKQNDSFNEDNFSAVIRMVSNLLTRDYVIQAYVDKPVYQSGLSKGSVIAGAITNLLTTCKDGNSLIIVGEDKSANTDFANFLADYSGVERCMVKNTPMFTMSFNLYRATAALTVVAVTACIAHKIYCSPKND